MATHCRQTVQRSGRKERIGGGRKGRQAGEGSEGKEAGGGGRRDTGHSTAQLLVLSNGREAGRSGRTVGGGTEGAEGTEGRTDRPVVIL